MSKIIVADDERGIVLYLSELVKQLGHEPIKCSNGKEACREIRKLPEGVHVPIIIVSGYNSEENIKEGITVGASDYMSKPILPTHLAAKIKTYLKTHSLYKNDFDMVQQHVELFNRYKIKGFIGYSSHSVVFRATDNTMGGKTVAVKLLHENVASDEISRVFVETIGQFSKLESGNILKIIDYGEFTGRLYLIQEFAERGDLAGILKYRNLDQMEAFRLVCDLTQALKCLHSANLVHLDIKPENIMVFGEIFKLGDFGINSIARKSGNVPINDTTWGTIAYSSPEVIESPGLITHKSDIYSAGTVLYQALTGDNPYDSDEPDISMDRQINFTPLPITEQHPDFSKLFSSLIQQMLNKDPEKRPSALEIEPLLERIKKEVSSNPKFKIHTDFKKVAEKNKAAAHIKAQVSKSKDSFLKKLFSAKADKAKDSAHAKQQIAGPKVNFMKKLFSKETLASAATVLLALGISAGLGFTAYKAFSHFYNKTPVVLPGAISVTICSKCSNIEERRIQDIKDITCSKCGGRLGYARECNECGHIFPYIPLTIDELPKNKLDFAMKNEERRQCPDCKSFDSSVVPTEQEKMGFQP
ncbi:MAG: protein kinase [Victivallales bacterium]